MGKLNISGSSMRGTLSCVGGEKITHSTNQKAKQIDLIGLEIFHLGFTVTPYLGSKFSETRINRFLQNLYSKILKATYKVATIS